MSFVALEPASEVERREEETRVKMGFQTLIPLVVFDLATLFTIVEKPEEFDISTSSTPEEATTDPIDEEKRLIEGSLRRLKDTKQT
ncbi:unnamed protein product [Dovyalis caffra]|uniref:Uncharacterized protein n=1 Tax=Dovyalis caffra TaxID=77055 RepID=A0AAV1SGF3_9ROSI|nr:unnamed protein product [Dovyalis caffra]